MTVRRARAADAGALASLSGQLGYPGTAADMRRRLERLSGRTDHEVLVAELAGAVVGWIHVFGADRVETPPFAEIGGLVVGAAARGRGVGAELVGAAEAWARARGYDVLRVRSNVVRDDAHAFYAKLGYDASKRQTVFVKTLTRGGGDPGAGPPASTATRRGRPVA